MITPAVVAIVQSSGCRAGSSARDVRYREGEGLQLHRNHFPNVEERCSISLPLQGSFPTGMLEMLLRASVMGAVESEPSTRSMWKKTKFESNSTLSAVNRAHLREAAIYTHCISSFLVCN